MPSGEATPEDWQNLAAHVSERLHRLGLRNFSALEKTSGVSRTTWRNLLNAGPVTFPGKPQQIMDALGWDYRSWDAVLAGGKPTLRKDQPAPSVAPFEDHEMRILSLEDRVRELERHLSLK